MGAKQSKRSVDISGKEAEGAGEVAVAGAGGEGRVEQLADADALKPQLNGDAHIHEPTDKQDIDSGTPENEKDATTEKEGKLNEEEKEVAPLTNGESEQKVENGESTPTLEDGKKPKKEKVKKKWSLRSISFSRKDKPKQEKKQKEEEPKTNGESEKVPEEAAEVAPEPAVVETAEEAKTESEAKEEKTPKTLVAEMITNGSTTPESLKDESPVAEEPSAPSPNIDRPEPEPEKQPEPEPQPETQPEQLPVNGLSLEEPAKEIDQEVKTIQSKEEPTAVTTEIVPEIPVIKEVCVEQMPLIDSTPPPLPANPPPSSVASFAATTMAPESTDASLANTADNAIPPPTSDPIANEKLDELPSKSDNELTITQTVSNELPTPVKQDIEEISIPVAQIEAKSETEKIDNAVPSEATLEVEKVKTDSVIIGESTTTTKQELENKELSENTDIEMPVLQSDLVVQEDKNDISNATEDLPSPPSPICDDVDVISSENNAVEDNVNNTQVTILETKEIVVVSNHISDTEKTAAPEKEIDSQILEQNLKAKSKDSLGNLIETIECNGNIEEEKDTSEMMPTIDFKEVKNATEPLRTVTTPDDSLPPSLSEANESAPTGMTSNDVSESFPPPPSELCRSESEPSPPVSPPELEPAANTPQDPLPISDKLAELIPEVPDVPELNTEMLQEMKGDVAVTN